ncbi:MAG: hypothetical protein JSV51_02840 [Candidatus Bathyarchaeota archaeon]|nr:MAG: hypothetical protein JSV51_02840 [Candidatus Bathyarchaeota archaeon]
MSEGKVAVSKSCREAVDKLHETMKLLDLSQIDLTHKEKRFTIAMAVLSIWIGFGIADFVSAATVVYSVGPVVDMRPENVFWNPDGGVYMNFTWFGLGLFFSVVLSLVFFIYSLFCSLTRRNARKKVKEMNQQLKDAKSVIVEVCPIELWYSGEA